MKLMVLTDFAELGHDLDEFPEFTDMAERTNLHNFTEAFQAYNNPHSSPYLLDHRLKENVACFIIWLALAAKGDYKVVIGHTRLGSPKYQKMNNWVGSNIEIYRQAKMFYGEALSLRQTIDKNIENYRQAKES